MRTRRWPAAVVAALVLGGCGGAAPRTQAPAASGTPSARPSSVGAPATPIATQPPAGTPSASGSAMTAIRRIVVDTDLGADDLLALAILLRDPTVEVLAVTVSGTGLAHCPAGLARLNDLLLAFDEPHPTGCGRSDPGPDGLNFPPDWRQPSDTLYGIDLRHSPVSSDPPKAATVLHGAIASSAGPVTIVALGPWTDLEDLLTMDPAITARLAGIHAMAGAIDVAGNVGPGSQAEWNVRADPSAFAAVLTTAVPITLVPLDATNRLPLTAEVAARAAEGRPAAGASLAFELFARNPFLLTAGQYLWDEGAALALLDPGLVTTEPISLRVVDSGGEAGRLVRDGSGRQVTAAMDADDGRMIDALARTLGQGAPWAGPATLGHVAHRVDPTDCTLVGEAPTRTGS